MTTSADLTPRALAGRARDLGGFSVRRLLPAPECAAIGPFVFLDHAGPADFAPGHGVDVRPHPHIGLATVTWLMEGELVHRDSLGTVQTIRPGEVNLMSAGRGVVHSERTPPERRAGPHRLHALQLWAAQPAALADADPDFQHLAGDALPDLALPGGRLRLLAGHYAGARAATRWPVAMWLAELTLAAGGEFVLPGDVEEQGIYVVGGSIVVGDLAATAGTLLVGLPPAGTLRAVEDAVLLLLGGARLDGPRTLWWNFVAHDPGRIRAAAARWRAGEFPPVPGEHEAIPLPEDALP